MKTRYTKWFVGFICCAFFIYYMISQYQQSQLKQLYLTEMIQSKEKTIIKSYLHNTKPVYKNGWLLIWSDEFSDTKINENIWNFEHWPVKKNNELQYYTPKNVYTENGSLKIVAKKESYKGRHYTSGAVHTKDTLALRYGKIEMRAKLPAGKGLLPAFWMLPNKDDTWLPEIDIVEMLGQKPNEIWAVSHYLNKQRKLESDFTSFTGPDFSKDFHIFSIEWTSESIAWFIDEQEIFRSKANIPNEPMYIYLNTAVGGNWPGNPDKATPFPNYFEVDYVKVYKKLGGS